MRGSVTVLYGMTEKGGGDVMMGVFEYEAVKLWYVFSLFFFPVFVATLGGERELVWEWNVACSVHAILSSAAIGIGIGTGIVIICCRGYCSLPLDYRHR